jgi:hypothetical protein
VVVARAVFNIEHEHDGDMDEVEFQSSWKNEEPLCSARGKRVAPS